MLKTRKKSGIIRKKCGCGFLIGTEDLLFSCCRYQGVLRNEDAISLVKRGK